MGLRAVEMTVWERQEQHNVVLHSDHGTQFTNGDYQKLLKRENLTSSIIAVGHCADNAACGGFFGILDVYGLTIDNTEHEMKQEQTYLIMSSGSIIQECDVNWRIKTASLRLYRTVRENGPEPMYA